MNGNSDIPKIFLVLFPVFFVGLWVSVTAILGGVSGWFELQKRFPDHPEDPLLRLRFQSGMMGAGVRMGGVLSLDACPSGLRVGIWKIFGPFQRSFFVPWSDIKVERGTRFFRNVADLRFGDPPVGHLMVYADVADRIARRASQDWPEPAPAPAETNVQALAAVARDWAAATIVVSLFFLMVMKVSAPEADQPPVLVAIGLPALVFGVLSVLRFLRRVRR